MYLYKKIYFWLIFLALAILFYTNSWIDLWASGIFFKDGEFYLKNYPPIKFIYDVTHPLLAIYLLTFISLLIYHLKTKKEPFNFTKKMLIFIIAVIIIAPGLVVNLGLKDNMGRARPKHIIQFNSDKIFTPAFAISNQCKKNCSFVCGHASAGYSLMALAFIFRRFKNRIFFGAFFVGTLIGLVRIIQGGHFLSDVIFSFFFTYITIIILKIALLSKNKL